MWTQHGHQIPGTPVEEGERPPRARCGGIGVCAACAMDASAAIAREDTTPEALESNTPVGDLVRSLQEGALTAKARVLVYDYVKARLEKTDTHVTFGYDEVYIVWFCKTLQHWKALLSTTLPDGMYYEVTYNGDKDEAFIDAYKKFDNVKVEGVSR